MKDQIPPLKSTLSAAFKYILPRVNFASDIETNREKLTEYITFMETVFPDVMILLCRERHKQLQYVSACCQTLFGYEAAYFKAMALEENIRLIHPDDLDGLRKCLGKIVEWETIQYDKFRFSLYYRMKCADGSYAHVKDDKMALRTDTGKFIFLTLMKNITASEAFTGVRLSIQQQVKGQFVAISAFSPKESQGAISPRQREIIALVSLGLSNKEIAERLNVSIYTVKNHKQNLFRKTHVKNSLALVNSFREERSVSSD
jgi:DNA-binding CsgD family transcriptional regulator